MSEQQVAFEHRENFQQGEVSGNVELGKFESYYEALFAEVIEDGIITAQERARLDKAALTLGLDKDRLTRLEKALQAAYEARHRVQIREIDTWDIEEEEVEQPRASLSPLAPSPDLRVAAMERHIKALEGRIAELEYELEQARTHIPIDIDLSDLDSKPEAPTVQEDIAELERRLRNNPRDVSSLRAMTHAAAAAGDLDRQWCATHVLQFLNEATDQEKLFHNSHATQGLIQPTSAVSRDDWRKLLFHPEQEITTGDIFAVVAPAVLLGRVSALRREKMLPRLEASKKQDPETSTIQAVRSVAWVASILGMRPPSLFVYPKYPGTAIMVPGLPPSTRLGSQALSGRTPAELAFLAARHLAYYREENFLRMLLPSVVDQEDVLLAALSIGNPGLPLAAQVKTRVQPVVNAMEPILEPQAIDRLRGLFLRFVEDGGRANLQRWARSVDRTCARAGLLISNDLGVAREMLTLENPAFVDELMDDMLAFMVSDRMSKLRKHIGISLS